MIADKTTRNVTGHIDGDVARMTIAANPQQHSRDQLYDWLRKRDFTILPSGEVVAYKGVGVADANVLHSLNQGTAYVDGVRHDGHIPNPVGSVVTMPREEVQHDPQVGCSVGLHVGTYQYAKSYAQGAMLQVAVNPADVVSVPNDGAGEKVRVCRYRVLDVIDEAPAEEPEPVTEEPTPGRIARWADRITRLVGR